jgi:DNA-directed RNA polymerase subunit N (RpoN/RPB10)
MMEFSGYARVTWKSDTSCWIQEVSRIRQEEYRMLSVLALARACASRVFLLRVQLKNMHRLIAEGTFNAPNQLENHGVRAFCASREFFTFTDGNGMRQSMNGVKDAVDSAVGNQVAGVVSLGGH